MMKLTIKKLKKPGSSSFGRVQESKENMSKIF
jgi:hypothetical protein